MILLLASSIVNPRYREILNFIRNADSVVTYVTNDLVEWRKENFDRHANISTFNRKHPGQFAQTIAKSKRLNLLEFLKGVAGPPTNALPGCFMPHHFVFVAKGKRHIELEICFTCSLFISYGSMPYTAKVNQKLLDRTEKVFGMKFVPGDPLPSKSKGEQPSFEISISKGKGRQL